MCGHSDAMSYGEKSWCSPKSQKYTL